MAVLALSVALSFTHRWEPRPESERTLLLLHGTGADEDDLIPLGDLLDPGANLLSPRGQVLENGMPRFFRRLAEGVFDLEDLTARTQQLADFVAAAAAMYAFDAAGVTAVGFSNGANIAAAMLLLRPGTVRQAVLLRAMVPLTPATSPDLAGTRVFLAAGRHDPIIPPANSDALAAMLRSAGAAVTVRWSDAGHQLRRDDVDAARDWMRASAPGSSPSAP
ncbi:MAG: alpha/beta hydrolase [Gemmatimonadaceae bacterium]